MSRLSSPRLVTGRRTARTRPRAGHCKVLQVNTFRRATEPGRGYGPPGRFSRNVLVPVDFLPLVSGFLQTRLPARTTRSCTCRDVSAPNRSVIAHSGVQPDGPGFARVVPGSTER